MPSVNVSSQCILKQETRDGASTVTNSRETPWKKTGTPTTGPPARIMHFRRCRFLSHTKKVHWNNWQKHFHPWMFRRTTSTRNRRDWLKIETQRLQGSYAPTALNFKSSLLKFNLANSIENSNSIGRRSLPHLWLVRKRRRIEGKSILHANKPHQDGADPNPPKIRSDSNKMADQQVARKFSTFQNGKCGTFQVDARGTGGRCPSMPL